MLRTTSNYKKTHGKLVRNNADIVLEQSEAAPLLGTAIECDDGWFQVTALFTRRAPISDLCVLGGVKISAKKAEQLIAITEIKKRCEVIGHTCPRFSGENGDEIAAARKEFEAEKAKLSKYDSVLVKDCYQGVFAANDRPGIWTRPAHLIGG